MQKAETPAASGIASEAASPGKPSKQDCRPHPRSNARLTQNGVRADAVLRCVQSRVEIDACRAAHGGGEGGSPQEAPGNSNAVRAGHRRSLQASRLDTDSACSASWTPSQPAGKRAGHRRSVLCELDTVAACRQAGWAPSQRRRGRSPHTAEPLAHRTGRSTQDLVPEGSFQRGPGSRTGRSTRTPGPLACRTGRSTEDLVPEGSFQRGPGSRTGRSTDTVGPPGL